MILMKKTILLICFFTHINSFSQNISDLFNVGKSISQNSTANKLNKEWFSTTEPGFTVSSNVTYNYSLHDNNGDLIGGKSETLDNKASFGMLYSINYPIFNKFTLGAVGGFQHQIEQNISALKFGGILRYHFVDYENVNINLMTAYNVALDDVIKSGMANVRLGLQFPIIKQDDFNVNLNIFWDYNYYEVNKPILNEGNEDPGSLIFKAYGISVGMQF